MTCINPRRGTAPPTCIICCKTASTYRYPSLISIIYNSF